MGHGQCRLDTLRLWDGSPLPPGSGLGCIGNGSTRSPLRGKILELERERQGTIAHGRGQAIEKVRQWRRLRAIGPSGAWIYVNEFFGWRR